MAFLMLPLGEEDEPPTQLRTFTHPKHMLHSSTQCRYTWHRGTRVASVPHAQLFLARARARLRGALRGAKALPLPERAGQLRALRW